MAEKCPHEHECFNRFDKLDDSIAELNRKLFVGNGCPPLSIQVDRLNTFKKTSCWFLAICTTTTLFVIAKLIYDQFAKG